MIWFSPEQEGEKGNLTYDNIAFLHVLSSFLVIIWLIIFFLIIRHLIELKRSTFQYPMKIQHLIKNKTKKQFEKQRKEIIIQLARKLFLLFAFTVYLFVWFNSEQKIQLVTFDPYQILEINESANETEIKKAYRKMAIQNHPDKNKSIKSANRFIQISKAYKCLTDQKTKEICKTYGNPDGQIHYEIGIGLPSFLIKQYSLHSTFFILFLLFFVAPFIFFRYIQRMGKKRKISAIQTQKQKILKIISDRDIANLRIGDLWVMASLLSQIDTIFKGNEVLTKEDENLCKKLLLRNSSLDWKQVSMLSSHAIFRVNLLYSYIYNNQDSDEIAGLSLVLSKKIVNLCEAAAKRNINSMGHLRIFQNAVKLSRQLFLRTDFFSLNQSKDKLILQGLHYKQIRSVTKSQNRLRHFLQQFSEQNREKIRKLISEIPILKLEFYCSIDEEPVEKISQHDYLTLDIRLTCLNPQSSLNYVQSRKFPLFVQPQYFLAIFKNQILVSTKIFQLKECQPTMTIKKTIKTLEQGVNTFQIRLYSLCEPIVQLRASSEVEVTKMRKKKKVQFHQEDLALEKKESNFFQRLIVFHQDHQELDLSDSQTIDQSVNKLTKNRQDNKQRKKNQQFSNKSF